VNVRESARLTNVAMFVRSSSIMPAIRPMSANAIFQQLPAYCDGSTTVSNVTPAADTGGAVNAVKVPVEALILKPATLLAYAA